MHTDNFKIHTDARGIKIGVLAGGNSSEREISLLSGRAVHKALLEEGCDARFIDIKAKPDEALVGLDIDLAFIALHGKYGEDGTVQGILEKLSIPYTGSGVGASRLALDKLASKDAFRRAGIKTPRYMGIDDSTEIREILKNFKLPFVLKPRMEGSSIGLSIVREEKNIEKAVEEMFLYGDDGLAEEYIDARELTVGILEDASLPVIEIIPKNKVYDFSAKYKDSDTRYVVPARIENDAYRRAQELGLAAHNALGLRDFSRIDMLMDDKGDIFVLEANSIPGMTERSLLPKAAMEQGVAFNKLCVKLVELALRRASYGKGKKENRFKTV